jgi:hypothetical protein
MSKEDKFHGDFAALSEEDQDAIINPKHYKIISKEELIHFKDKGLEYLDIMRYALSKHKGVIAHVLGQVFKYSFRLGGKDDALQDAKKIAWYGNRLVEEIEFERGITKVEPRGEYPTTGRAELKKFKEDEKKQTVDAKLHTLINFMHYTYKDNISLRPYIQDLRVAKEVFRKLGVKD